MLPAVGFFGGTAPLSDAAPFSLAGVPVVSLITTPLYLFDPRDTTGKVDNRTTETVRDATTRIIESTRDLTTTAHGVATSGATPARTAAATRRARSAGESRSAPTTRAGTAGRGVDR